LLAPVFSGGQQAVLLTFEGLLQFTGLGKVLLLVELLLVELLDDEAPVGGGLGFGVLVVFDESP
jgi:hypothetical protein